MVRKVLLIMTVLLLSVSLGFSNTKFKESESKEEYSIPKVYFEGNINEMYDKSDERKIKLKYESNDINFEGYASIKIQGSSSLRYEKKNYTIKLYDDENLENKKTIDFGWGKQSKYCLKANWIDKTHARNVVTAKLVGEVQEKYSLFESSPNNGAIDGFPVEIYINDEFLGVYTWNIPKDAWMFDMDENNPNHLVVVAEEWSDNTLFKEEPRLGSWEFEVGEPNEENLNKFKRLANFIMYSDDETFENEFRDYLDLNATLNYFIIMEFAELQDNVTKNLILVTYDGNIWSPTLYDLDSSWGTSPWGTSKLDYYNSYDYLASTLWQRVSEVFKGEIANRYFELRKNILTKEHVMNLFYDFENMIPRESFKKEEARWTLIPGYSYTQIEKFLDIRIPLIDDKMKKRKES